MHRIVSFVRFWKNRGNHNLLSRLSYLYLGTILLPFGHLRILFWSSACQIHFVGIIWENWLHWINSFCFFLTLYTTTYLGYMNKWLAEAVQCPCLLCFWTSKESLLGKLGIFKIQFRCKFDSSFGCFIFFFYFIWRFVIGITSHKGILLFI